MYYSPDDPTVVSWNNPTMEALIRMAIDKPTGDITQGELNSIFQLSLFSECYACTGSGYEALNPSWGGREISLFENGTGTIYIENYPYSNMTDFSDLEKLNNLVELSMYGYNISDISWLANMSGLWSVSLNDTITPLSYLLKLESVTITGDYITDLSPLAGLSNLTFVSVTGDNITDWSPVAHVEMVYGRP